MKELELLFISYNISHNANHFKLSRDGFLPSTDGAIIPRYGVSVMYRNITDWCINYTNCCKDGKLCSEKKKKTFTTVIASWVTHAFVEYKVILNADILVYLTAELSVACLKLYIWLTCKLFLVHVFEASKMLLRLNRNVMWCYIIFMNKIKIALNWNKHNILFKKNYIIQPLYLVIVSTCRSV